jgi:hypothetical protein
VPNSLSGAVADSAHRIITNDASVTIALSSPTPIASVRSTKR